MSARAERVTRHFEFLSGKQRGKYELGDVFRQRSDRSENERRWSTEKNRYRQRLIETLCFRVMKAAAFLNLPVQPGRVRIVDLDAIDAEIVFLRDRVFSVDQRQRDEWSTVFLPRRQHGQLIESSWTIDDLRDR